MANLQARVYPCESSIDLNGEHRKAMADQIATVSKQRLKSRLATLSLDDIRAIERAIRVHLGLSSLTSFS
jgi:mRNA interferase MazF